MTTQSQLLSLELILSQRQLQLRSGLEDLVDHHVLIVAEGHLVGRGPGQGLKKYFRMLTLHYFILLNLSLAN